MTKYSGSSTGREAGNRMRTRLLFREEKLGIILSPKASLEGAKSRAYIGGGTNTFLEMESSKLF